MRSVLPLWALMAMGCALSCQAQMAPAHVALSSYASASYRDAKGSTFNSYSPQAYCVVRQVYGVTGQIVPENNWRTWGAATNTFVTATFTNTGNGLDRFRLSFASENLEWWQSQSQYEGCITNSQGGPIQDNTVELDRGQSYTFRVVFRAPNANVLSDGLFGVATVSSLGTGEVGSMSSISWSDVVVAGRRADDWVASQQWSSQAERVHAVGADGRYAYLAGVNGNLFIGKVGELWPTGYPINCFPVGRPSFSGVHMAWSLDDGRLLIVDTSPLDAGSPPSTLITRPVNLAPVVFEPVAYGPQFIVLTADNRIHKVTRQGVWMQSVSVPFVATTPPVAINGNVFVGTSTGRIACLNTTDLAVRWQLRVADSPIVGRLQLNDLGSYLAFRTADNQVGSLSVAGQRLRWLLPQQSPIVDLVTAGPRSVFILCEDRVIRGLDLITGANVAGYPTIPIPGSGALGSLAVATRDEPDAPPYIWTFSTDGVGYAFCSTLGLNYYMLRPSINGTVTSTLPTMPTAAGVAFGFQGAFGSDGYHKSWFYAFSLK